MGSERVQEALKLERLCRNKALDDIAKERQQELSGVCRELEGRGLLGRSGYANDRIAEVHERALAKMANAIVRIRREMVESVPELASESQIAELRKVIESVANSYTGICCPAVEPVKSEAYRELEILRREVELGMYPRKSRQPISVNIQNSTVAALNLGTVVGDMNAAVGELQSKGIEEIAAAVKLLAEAVANAGELEQGRKELIESLALIAEQAGLPESKRKPGALRAVFSQVGLALSTSKDIAELWRTFGPTIAKFFGWTWL